MDSFWEGAALLRRDNNATNELLDLLSDPFSSSLQQESLAISFATSIGFTALIAVGFSLLRPYNSVVYAPKLKHADDKHAPPPLGKGVLSWLSPILKTSEQDLVPLVGLDAVVFLRFTRMCRNILLCVSILGCAILIPVNWINDHQSNTEFIARLTPLNTSGEANWAIVACAWLFNFVMIGFLWWNYKAVLKLRRQYYNSTEYHASLHARTLMITDIPPEIRSDEGMARLIDVVAPTSSFSRTAIGRNVKDLPVLIDQHAKTVRKLEEHLAKYLYNPDQLPAARPTCRPSKKDPSYGTYPKGQKLDAIEYLTDRIRELEMEIKEVRASIDKRHPMSYGFASYSEIEEAHSIAYAARNKHPKGTTIVLAPRPNDIIWDNMNLTKSARKWNRAINNLLVLILTFLWIAPNAMISIFLVNLTNLGQVWPAFHDSLSANKTWWSLVQGVASPALTSLIFLLLPIIFRRLSMRAGDRSKTARERHVTAKLYSFFVFNNLIIFSVFSTVWTFVTNVIANTSSGENAWQAIEDANFGQALFISLCKISPFWVTWLLQRNLGAAIDLAQMWTLFTSFCSRKFRSPTPREMIELTAPPAFDYASYYNYFLYYITVTLCYATIQPLVIPAAALYFCIDVYLKKYLLMYIFITKTESGGMFWRMTFNRMVFGTMLSNLVVFLACWVQGDAAHFEAYATVPLPFVMLAFKYYCAKAFDDKMHYFNTARRNMDPEQPDKIWGARNDRLGTRYGHPALYKPLITPMVHARAQNILASIYRGRLTDSNKAGSADISSISGYSDTYALEDMKVGQPGRAKNSAIPGFEVVPESQLDFQYYKNRAEFAEEHGGGGQIFGRAEDLVSDRPGTPGSYFRGDSPGSSRAGSPVPMLPPGAAGVAVAAAAARRKSSAPGLTSLYQQGNDSQTGLIYSAADMAASPPPFASSSARPASRDVSLDRSSILGPGYRGGGPQGYGGLPQRDIEEDIISPADPLNGGNNGARRASYNPTAAADTAMSYDYFRSSRRRN